MTDVPVVNFYIYLSFTFYILKYFYDLLTLCVLYVYMLFVLRNVSTNIRSTIKYFYVFIAGQNREVPSGGLC